MHYIQNTESMNWYKLLLIPLTVILWKNHIVAYNENEAWLLTQKNSLPIMLDSITICSIKWKHLSTNVVKLQEKRKDLCL